MGLQLSVEGLGGFDDHPFHQGSTQGVETGLERVLGLENLPFLPEVLLPFLFTYPVVFLIIMVVVTLNK